VVPVVLLSGHHQKIRAWRRAEAEAVTKARRPDLWSRYRDRQGSRETITRTVPGEGAGTHAEEV
jgi:tRNA (guanine37-N1)-methyltransferase